MKSISALSILMSLLVTTHAIGQADRWQQAVNYSMEVDMDVSTHTFTGRQTLQYTNNSPDTLKRIFYHLQFNAFQPGSMMDVRARTIEDPDRRVGDRISKLKPNEIGYLYPTSLKQNGSSVEFEVVGTILEVDLNKALLPGTTTTFEMEFNGQVPVQVRRSGRNNAEGISYSMSQWYPKMAEYDYEGWHASPYIGREFYGVWGDFDVKISIDPAYVVAASGYIQNPNEVGYGYEDPGVNVKKSNKKLTWHFKAPNVHDFLWAADPDYVQIKTQGPNDTLLRFFYQPDSITNEVWPQLPEITAKALEFMNRQYGTYPYKVYNVIQGGDGGMEYPMATLITGRRSLPSLVGVTVHEFFHSWYQMVLGSNESLYPWMDEGFTSYASGYTMNYLFDRDRDALAGSYANYYALVRDGKEEPMSTHSDHYHTNRAYGTAAYSKGAVTLGQLEYIMGKPTFDRAFRRYFNTWKFRHPNPTDFKRIMEKESGLELDWYFLDWVGTTKTIDYGIQSVAGSGNSTLVTLEQIGELPMPMDVLVTYTDGSKEMFYLPLRIMRGAKPDDGSIKRIQLPDWPWTYPTYTFDLVRPISQVVSLEIDPSNRLADIDQSNNYYEVERMLTPTFPNAKKN